VPPALLRSTHYFLLSVPGATRERAVAFAFEKLQLRVAHLLAPRDQSGDFL